MWIAQTGPEVAGVAPAALSTEIDKVAAEWRAQGLMVVEVTTAEFERDAATHENVVSGGVLAKRLRPVNPRAVALKGVRDALGGVVKGGASEAILKALEVLLSG